MLVWQPGAARLYVDTYHVSPLHTSISITSILQMRDLREEEVAQFPKVTQARFKSRPQRGHTLSHAMTLKSTLLWEVFPEEDISCISGYLYYRTYPYRDGLWREATLV